ncbi:anion permease [Caproicibacter sp.]|uniref:inorganic phosphate transporter n=1 Tax=Caproicibacter sp. TaxID=2814884 RepID=UPI0039892B66
MVNITVQVLSVILIFISIFITGFHDEGNLIATIITSRSLNAVPVFVIAFASQFFGILFLGTKVALGTVNGLFNLDSVSQHAEKIPTAICAAILGTVIWNLITWAFAIPSSSSHALVGGLLGPFILQFGAKSVNGRGLIFSVLIPLFTSPIIGYIVGMLFFKASKWLFSRRFIRVRIALKGTQIFTCVLINAFQGSNDAQKGIGVLALLSLTMGNTLQISRSTILFSSLALSFGLLFGGLKMIRSVGTRIYGVRPLHSMCSQVSAASVIVSASLLGFPVSGTQIVNSAILGVGSADRPNAVGWEFAKNMLKAWVITIPATFTLSSILFLTLKYFWM